MNESFSGPPLSAPASHIFFSQRLRLHYIDWGNRNAPPMVLVHGMQDHCRTWDDLAVHLKDRFHLVAPDLRGHGDSDWVRGSAYHYLDYIYDLHQLIHQLNFAPVTLVGHSLGGAIAALFSGAFPECVARLVVIEGIGQWSDEQPEAAYGQKIRDWVAQTRGLSGRQPRRYRSLKEAYERMQQANPQLAAEQALHLTTHGSNQNEDGTFSWKFDNYTFNFSASGMSAAEMQHLWGRIDCPVLVVNADGGLEHRIGHGGTLQHFRDARLRVVRDAGHWTYHDKPREVLALIDEFCGG